MMMKLFTAAVLAALVGTACCSHTRLHPDAGIEPDATRTAQPSPVTPPPFRPLILPLFQQLMSVQPDEKPSKQPVECGTGKACVPVYVFNNQVEESSVADGIAWLTAVKAAKPAAILIELNTKGGGTDTGFRFIRAMENVEAPIYCVAEHEAQSEGFAILQACHHRYMTKRTMLMTHKPYFTSRALVATIEDLENDLADLKVTAATHAELCSSKLKISRAEYDSKVAGKKDWHMGWEEAVSVGAVDKIVSSVRAVRDALRAGLSP